jgi:hypothetical protein
MRHCPAFEIVGLAEVAAEMLFMERTGADHLRCAKFVGLRDDKEAFKVIKET